MMVVLTLSRRVFLGAFADEKMMWSVRYRRWKPNISQDDLVVRRSQPGEVFPAWSPRHTPVQQSLNGLGLQHADFQTKRGRRRIVQPRAEPSEAGPHETNPSISRERSPFSWIFRADIKPGSSVYSSGQLRLRAVELGMSIPVFVAASSPSNFAIL